MRAHGTGSRRSQRPPARERDHAQQARAAELDVVPARRGALRGARRGRPATTTRGSSCSPARAAAFCSGLDLHDRGIPPNTQDLGFSRLAMRSMSYMSDVVPAMRRIPQPIIAAINGPAYGGGMCLTLGTDIRYAARVGGVLLGRDHQRAHVVGARRDLPAARARSARRTRPRSCSPGARSTRPKRCASGSCRRSCPTARSLDLALDTAEEMTTKLSCFGVMMTKQTMWSNLEITSLAAAIELENRNQLLAGYTGNLDEAIAAFREKRPPVYKE